MGKDNECLVCGFIPAVAYYMELYTMATWFLICLLVQRLQTFGVKCGLCRDLAEERFAGRCLAGRVMLTFFPKGTFDLNERVLGRALLPRPMYYWACALGLAYRLRLVPRCCRFFFACPQILGARMSLGDCLVKRVLEETELNPQAVRQALEGKLASQATDTGEGQEQGKDVSHPDDKQDVDIDRENEPKSEGHIIKKIPDGQVVILGAGYDTRAYRRIMANPDDQLKFFEVDRPPIQTRKRNLLLKKYGVDFVDRLSRNVTFVKCDFEQEKMIDCLLAQGMDPLKKTVVLLEGVTPYIPHEATKEIFSQFQQTMKNKVFIILDFINKTKISSVAKGMFARVIGEAKNSPKIFWNNQEIAEILDKMENVTRHEDIQSIMKTSFGARNVSALMSQYMTNSFELIEGEIKLEFADKTD